VAANQNHTVILLVVDSLDLGGAEQSMVLLAHGLGQRGHDVAVVPVFREGLLLEEARRLGVRVVPLRASTVADGIRRLRGLALTLKARLLHSVLFRSDVVSRVVAAQLGIPCVGSLVSDTYGEARVSAMEPRRRMKLELVRAVDAASAGVMRGVVAISRAIAADGCRTRGIDQTRVVIIPRGRNPSAFGSRSWSPGPPRILCVGRMVEGKGHRDLIAAFRDVVRVNPDARLLLAGDGPERRNLEALAAGPGVEFLGFRRDVADLMSTATCLVFPSHHEGQGGVVVEAMLARIPLIAAAIPAVVEHVDSSRGRLYPAGDSAALGAAINEILADPVAAAVRAEHAQAYAHAHLSIDGMVEAHARLYRDLLGSK
jgi:glycosyltransferase involved in cell wall biosynthesis